MTPTLDDPLQSPQDSDSDSNLPVRKNRPAKSPLNSVASLPYRRSNASLSNLFASTTSLPTQSDARSPEEPGTVTPPTGAINGSVFSPSGSGLRSPSPALSTRLGGERGASGETRDLILRAFAPHVSVLASLDTEELIRHKGINGGLLELLRPYGEHVPGKVTIRDSSGASKSWEDYAVRFMGVKDGLENPRLNNRNSTDSAGSRNGQRASMLEYKPARLRSGGDVPQIEDLVERHLTFAEEQSGPVEADYINHKDVSTNDAQATSPFFLLYLRRLLSGLPMVPSETISHPVASVIAISSRSPNPIEELRNLFASSNTGEHRLPQWVHNEFLRYYVLIHDEDYDDIQKSTALFDQMKRHFGLHCHLLRLRSTQCLPSDDDAVKLPQCEWFSAAEELTEIVRRESSEDDEDPTPVIFESDANALRAFVREMVTQSVIPSMERASATWNDQVASRRRGISGRFMSLSKRFTAFGGGGNRNSSMASFGNNSSNYDSLQGFYRPDAPEAVMRKLADYAMMLRDFKLAQSTYEILCQDFKNDKAWRHYAAANEMAAVSSLIATGHLSSKVRVEGIDQYLETAYYSYLTRVGAPYNALRTLLLGIELLKLRGGSALDDAARWSSKILDDRLVGPVGHALVMERLASCYAERKGAVAGLPSGEKVRKAAFWDTMACDAWLRLDKGSRAEKCLDEATRLYRSASGGEEQALAFDNMRAFLSQLQDAVNANRSGPQHLDGTDLLPEDDDVTGATVEPLQTEPEIEPTARRRPSIALAMPGHGHRKSVSTSTASGVPAVPGGDPLGIGGAGASTFPTTGLAGGAPLSPHAEDAGSAGGPRSPGPERRDDGFE